MSNSTIEERCNFETQRLTVGSWTAQILEGNSELNFAEKVIEILSPNVTKALPDGWQDITTINHAQEWISEREKESHFVTIQLSSINEIIGFVFLYETDAENEYHDLRFGYLLSERVWGKGLGTELIDGLIKWCKKQGDIKSISGGVETDNIASINVLEKTGFSVSTVDKKRKGMVFYEYQFDTLC
ncbi:GNAT family N-acetyltransferase [Marinilabilia rubra]|uniref:N-acetyltransferase n=1 Tax=Marinilabilia rubra TaxID=2162893 RepID=A0A2U2B991_9BACT|nr:GNAT family N-acetyltransferase [Marinilabilia rubra]PWD99627.1 N-acetyltransferase [Marinilabilia rubra]